MWVLGPANYSNNFPQDRSLYKKVGAFAKVILNRRQALK